MHVNFKGEWPNGGTVMLRFKLAYGTNGYRRHPLAEAVKRIAEFGYDGVDLMADRPHAYPMDLDEEARMRIKKLLEDYNLELSNVHGGSVKGAFPTYEPTFVSPQEEDRAKRIEYTKDCVDLAAFLGAKNVSIVSGKCEAGGPPETAWDWFIEGVTECVDYGRERGVIIALEPEPEFLIETSDEALRALNRVDSAWFGINFDVGHVHYRGESIPKSVEKLGKRIVHVHLEDIKDLKHFHRVPGDGDINFREFIESLGKAGYRGFLTVELYTYAHDPDPAAQRSISYLRELLSKQ